MFKTHHFLFCYILLLHMLLRLFIISVWWKYYVMSARVYIFPNLCSVMRVACKGWYLENLHHKKLQMLQIRASAPHPPRLLKLWPGQHWINVILNIICVKVIITLYQGCANMHLCRNDQGKPFGEYLRGSKVTLRLTVGTRWRELLESKFSLYMYNGMFLSFLLFIEFCILSTDFERFSFTLRKSILRQWFSNIFHCDLQ